jgi:hypothetical protein
LSRFFYISNKQLCFSLPHQLFHVEVAFFYWAASNVTAKMLLTPNQISVLPIPFVKYTPTHRKVKLIRLLFSVRFTLYANFFIQHWFTVCSSKYSHPSGRTKSLLYLGDTFTSASR